MPRILLSRHCGPLSLKLSELTVDLAIESVVNLQALLVHLEEIVK